VDGDVDVRFIHVTVWPWLLSARKVLIYLRKFNGGHQDVKSRETTVINIWF